MKNIKILVIILLFFIALTACDKDDHNEKFEIGIIKDLGDPSVDGCGWIIEISSKSYKPQNLAEEFKIDNLKVELKCNKLESKATCGFSEPIDEIYIEDIKKKTYYDKDS